MIAGACAAPRDKGPVSTPLVSQGEVIARESCGECHGMGESGPSPLADAPPLHTLRGRYSRSELTILLSARMTEVHPRMPKLRLDEDQVDALLDYLDRRP